jgi:RNA polymerase sigma-B factor
MSRTCPTAGLGDPMRELQLRLDEREAATTVPVRSVPRSWPVADRPAMPAVDPSLWLLHVQWYRRRDPGVRRTLVAEYEAPTRNLARRYYRHREPLDDLVQVALEALLLALDRFEPERRIPFLGYASPTITGALKRHFRDVGWSVRVPRRAHELAAQLRSAADDLEQDLGRAPTASELADVVGIDEREVHDALRAADARNADSVDASPMHDANPALAVEDRALHRSEDLIALRQALALVDPDDREVLLRYFVHQLSQDAIATELGVSQMHVSRTVARTLRVLRSHLSP